MSNECKSCGIREAAASTGNSKSLSELEWQYLFKIYMALKVKGERGEVNSAEVFLTAVQGENSQ